ncbi:MAG: hypothetical protein HY551_03820 [Elusimicrobia bacterium]|nr:hypothetical protein [Elusimicrobiota bacterium]
MRWLAFVLAVSAATICCAADAPAGKPDEQAAATSEKEAARPRSPAAASEKGGKPSAAEIEKQKALQNPYPNDLGSGEIDALVKGYPKDFQEGYKLVNARCAQCHLPQRPLHSRFLEPYVGDEKVKDAAQRKKLKDAKIAEWKKSNPELFEDLTVWQAEGNIWERYVKRMMSKPGCKMTKDEARKIWLFLVYDSNQRKIGKSADSWKAHRKKLVEDFKKQYPERYEELEKQKDL